MSKNTTNLAISITELKKDPMGVLKKAKGKSTPIMNRKALVAYLVPAKAYTKMLDMLEDYELAKLVKQRLKQRDQAISVSIEDL